MTFDLAQRAWTIDLQAAQAASVTVNVAELLAARLLALPEATRQVLKVAACLGNESQLSHIERLDNMQTKALRGQIVPAARTGLIEATDLGTLRFVHDRIQQAAYRLMSADEACRLHLRIGHMLLAEAPPGATPSSIFAILEHLNKSLSLVTTAEARLTLMERNLHGAREAKRAGAYDVATGYLSVAFSLLESQGAGVPQALVRSMHIEQSDNDFCAAN